MQSKNTTKASQEVKSRKAIRAYRVIRRQLYKFLYDFLQISDEEKVEVAKLLRKSLQGFIWKHTRKENRDNEEIKRIMAYELDCELMEEQLRFYDYIDRNNSCDEEVDSYFFVEPEELIKAPQGGE